MRLALSILFFLPLAFAIDFSVPSNLTSAGPCTISWTSSDSDPGVFSIELVNTNLFHNAIAIANNVQKTAGSISITLPAVPAGDGYTIEAVDISNINSVFGTSGDFSIGAPASTTSSTAASTSASSSNSTSLSSGSVTTSARSTSSTTGFGVTVTSASSGSSGSSTGTSSSSSASASSFNGNGALGSNIGSGVGGSIAAAVVGVIAGAIFV